MNQNSLKGKKNKLILDSIIFVVSLIGAWFILKSQVFHQTLESLLAIRFLAEIFAGALYTSFATSPLAVAAIILISRQESPILVGLLGGLGALAADMLIVRLLRNNASSDISTLATLLRVDKVRKGLKLAHLDFLLTLLGSLIIASPLPDELGLILFSESRLSLKQIAMLSLSLNTAGIMTIAITANLLT